MKTCLKRKIIKLFYFIVAIGLIYAYSINIKVVKACTQDNYQNLNSDIKTLNNSIELIDDEDEEPYNLLNLNVKYDVSISAGDIRYFMYTPESDAYFVVETYGSLDTKLHISNTYSGEISDDDSGEGLNARVEFRGVKGKTIYIATKLYSRNLSGNYLIQLRRQRASLFAYNDRKGNTTIPDLNTPSSKLSPMFETVRYENKSASDALSKDERDLTKINSEIMFFSGHGYKNSDTEKGFGVVFKNGDITTSTSVNMDRTKVAVWAACYSANSTNSKKISIAEYSVTKGAKSAIGFTESVSFSSSRTFTDRFFSKLSEGSTIKEAASYGSSGLVWPWDSAKKYVIFGDDSIRITDTTTSTSSFALRSVNANILTELDNNVYIIDIDQNSKRYYEKINDILTNSFVDITYDKDSNIIDVKDYRKDLSRVGLINGSMASQSLLPNILIDGAIYQLDDELSRNIVYIDLNNVMTPVIIIVGTYINDGITIEYTRCINLTNGQELEYSEINSLSI